MTSTAKESAKSSVRRNATPNLELTGIPVLQRKTAPTPNPDDVIEQALANFYDNERFKHIRVHKNQLTTKPSPPEHIELFRQQEVERYKYPDRPWIYFNGDGSTSLVAPVIKKKNQQINNKPREHAQLKSQRPAIVTLLCLVRDAVSRLPDGIGTRADILELIKHSQWIKLDGTPIETQNNIVSGALDRLHQQD